jgi:hypothetical protein
LRGTILALVLLPVGEKYGVRKQGEVMLESMLVGDPLVGPRPRTVGAASAKSVYTTFARTESIGTIEPRRNTRSD